LVAFVCQCPTGYYGLCCEIRNYCIPNPCNNNGFCLQTSTGYICSCSYPFTGTNCQQSISKHFFFILCLLFSFSSDHNNYYDYNYYYCYCDTSAMWSGLCMCDNTMSVACCDKSMYTKSMVRF
jgi:hypothetical protein